VVVVTRKTTKTSAKGSALGGEMAGFRTAGSSSSLTTQKVAGWERHTKGIGTKLLLKVSLKLEF
jgi:hypothetical protein